MSNELEEEVVTEKINSFPKRYILACLIFLGFCVLYGLRVNLNIAIGVMCNNNTQTINGFSVTKVGILLIFEFICSGTRI